MTNPANFTELLIGMFYENEEVAAQMFDYLGTNVESVRNFNDAGLMTSNEGVVVRLADGSEFQLTVVQRN